MRHLIDDFQIYPGEHCGSVAMRGLLDYYCDLKLPEAAVFGLGAGVASVFMNGAAMDPPLVLFGRTLSMESDLGQNLGIDYREQTESDDDEAWRLVREETLAGRPVMLSGDIFYLDYRDYKVHFPAHRFILLGFDDEAEQAFIGDRIRDEPETCSLGAVRRSRNAPVGVSSENLWGSFQNTHVGTDLRTAAERAIRQCARQMLEPADLPEEQRSSVAIGLEATRKYAAALPAVHGREDAQAIASFNASCLEKFGNGGGNFRRLYAGFLSWARELDAKLVPATAPQLATDAADAWTAASAALFRASDSPEEAANYEEAGKHVERAAELESALFTQLAETVG